MDVNRYSTIFSNESKLQFMILLTRCVFFKLYETSTLRAHLQ